MFPCVPLSEVDRPLGRVTGATLASFWKSETYSAARRDLAKCRACYWNCHTEMNLALRGPLSRGTPSRGSPKGAR